MLHTLGRMMIVFYMPDQWNLMQECSHRSTDPQEEDRASRQILGLKLEEIGRATAGRWGLPKGLLESMVDTPPSTEELTGSQWLAALSTMSSRCASAMCEDEESGNAKIAELAASYAGMLGVSSADVLGAVEGAKQASSSDLTAVHQAKRAQTEKRASTQTNIDPRPALLKILAHGVSDMRDAVSSASPSQMIAMALETIYQGLDLRRAIAFLHQHKEGQYCAKMCFGAGVQALLPSLVFDDVYHPDVFKTALSNDKLIFIENAKHPDFAPKLPHWWQSSLAPVESFLILPLTLNRHPTAFIYGDWGKQPPVIILKEQEFTLLNEIRSLLVHALERRRQATLKASVQR
jgi:hypothetical protein